MSRQNLKRARSERAGTRANRSSNDRAISEDRELSDSERVDMLRRSFFQSALPDLPKRPGWHNCWLTTQNPRDPVHGRMRLGYELLQADEIPEFEHLAIKDGPFKGAISVNEMIAARLPIHLYESFMRAVHYDAPLQEEEAIYSEAMAVSEEAQQSARRGGKMKAPIIEVGTQELGQPRAVPTFSDEDE
jgi:hypothetical protein